MPATKNLTDLIDYTAVLPYASELFGIYQPLLGWKSKRLARRFDRGNSSDKASQLDRLKRQFVSQVNVHYGQDCQVSIELRPGVLQGATRRTFDSIVLAKTAENLPPNEPPSAAGWQDVITRERIESIIRELAVPTFAAAYAEACRTGFSDRPAVAAGRTADTDGQTRVFLSAFESQLRYESSLAGALLFLKDQKNFDELKAIFYGATDNHMLATHLSKILTAFNAYDAYMNLENLDPQDQEDIKNVALSPISVVHLFRQYFFELDTFLGTPVSHVWLSPGGSVELIEVHTRKTIVEKTIE